MTEVASAVAELPALPTVLRGGGAVERAQWWLRGPGKHAAWFAALAPVAALVGSFILGIVLFEVFYAEGFGIALIGLYLIACGLFFVLSLATAIANGGKKRRLEVANLRHQPRLQGLKDWFIRGDIAETEYERLKAAIEPATKGETADARAQEVGTFLSSYGLFAALLLIVLVPIDIILVVELDGDIFLLMFIILLATIFVVATSALAIVRGSQLKNDAAQLAADFEKEITRLEEELLRAGHGRKRGLAPTISSAGPAFSPYMRR